jgi:glycosyltransferase involved in cell wall biosynthesis
MAKVSIVIPSRNEIHKTNTGETVLQRMVRDIYEKATGEFEVIVAFDGPPYQQLPDYSNLTLMKLPQRGLKPSVNNAVRIATGKYICKFDSHCAVSEGFDEVLKADMEDNWIVMPRFYVLDAEEWKWQDERFYDYFFLHWPS